MPTVFVSYTHTDRPTAQALAKFLESKGFAVWWDREIAGGQDYRQEIDKQLGAADYIVPLWSRASVESHWVIEEADHGANTRKLVPVLIENAAIPRGFRTFQAVDLRNWDGEPDFPELTRLMRTLSGSGELPPPPAKQDAYAQAPLKKAATRNTMLILLAAFWVLSNRLWGTLFEDAEWFETISSPYIAMGFFVLAALAWFARTKALASIALAAAVLAANALVLAVHPHLGFPETGVDSTVCALTLAIAITWSITLGAIRLSESLVIVLGTVAMYVAALLYWSEASQMFIAANALQLGLIGLGVCAFRLKWIQKFYL